MSSSRRSFIKAAGALALASSFKPAFAQTVKLPHRQIRLIVPFAAGGGVDVFARLLAEVAGKRAGVSFVIDNRAGANGSIGGNAVRLAEPDGSTLLFSASTHVMARQMMKNAAYNPLTDFTPIARVGEAPMLLVMAPDRKPANVRELVKSLKAEPAKWAFGAAALGAAGHLATIAFNQAIGANTLIVPYRGTAPALNDVAGGHIQLLIDPLLALLPMAQDRKVIGLAVTSARRARIAPDIPTLAESGLEGFDHASWYGVWGPKGMPAGLVATLNDLFQSAVRDLDAAGNLAPYGVEPVLETPEAFAHYAADYVQRNAALLRSVNYEPV